MTRQILSSDLTVERVALISEMLRTYTGTDPVLASYSGRVQAGGHLTSVELLKVVNTERAVEPAPAPKANLISGTYTVVNPKTGGHRTVQIADNDFEWMTSNKPPVGTRALRGMNGPDNEQNFVWLGVLYPNGTAHFTQKSEKYPTLVAAAKWLVANAAGNEASLAKAYALVSGRCSFCNLKLTAPESVTSGYGPDCAEKRGLPWGVVPTATAPVVDRSGAGLAKSLTELDAQAAIDTIQRDLQTRVGWQSVKTNPATVVTASGPTTTANGFPFPKRTYEQLFGNDD